MIFHVSHRKLKENISGLLGVGGKGYVAPPRPPPPPPPPTSQIIGEAWPLCPPSSYAYELDNLPSTKDLAPRQGFDVRRLTDSNGIFRAPKTWL